jgi:hypothetical protein
MKQHKLTTSGSYSRPVAYSVLQAVLLLTKEKSSSSPKNQG